MASRVAQRQACWGVTPALKLGLRHLELARRHGDDVCESGTGRKPLQSGHLAARRPRGHQPPGSLAKPFAAQVDLAASIAVRNEVIDRVRDEVSITPPDVASGCAQTDQPRLHPPAEILTTLTQHLYSTGEHGF